MKVSKITNNRLTLYIVIFTIVIFIIAYFIDIRFKKKENELRNNYKYTIGYFSSYIKSGDGGLPYITYYYYVNNKKYYGTTDEFRQYEFCEYKIVTCQSKRFWVIYSPDKPKISLINLTVEIQDIINPLFPDNLNDFK